MQSNTSVSRSRLKKSHIEQKTCCPFCSRNAMYSILHSYPEPVVLSSLWLWGREPLLCLELHREVVQIFSGLVVSVYFLEVHRGDMDSCFFTSVPQEQWEFPFHSLFFISFCLDSCTKAASHGRSSKPGSTLWHASCSCHRGGCSYYDLLLKPLPK